LAIGAFAVPVIRELLASGMPIFGICLGHQLLALALGARTVKMHLGHRGGNHPVQDLATGRVQITSQNHGFVVSRESLPPGLEETHTSLFDGTLQGLRLKERPVFSVQYHPEASPGPQDNHPLFEQFANLMRQ
jgi:carbamoyl-phosphate synthase small subunit